MAGLRVGVEGEDQGRGVGASASYNPIKSVAKRLVTSYGGETPLLCAPGHELPSPAEVRLALSDLKELIFPGFTSSGGMASERATTAMVEARLAQVRVRLSQQVFRGLHHRCQTVGAVCPRCEDDAVRISDQLLESLPDLRALLLSDVRAAYDGDPAASGADEVAFSYPGIQAICVHRIAHELVIAGASIVPRIMSELSHSETGIDIHPAATIGESFFIDHGTGVVIGETTLIGNHVRIYQGVTLGALSLPTDRVRSPSPAKRHPTIEDQVIIYANATILGGATVIGKGAVIGGNCFITASVAPGERRSV